MMLGPRIHHRACHCGWEGVYNTTGYADKALRGHDCNADWSPRPCTHNGRHQHGHAATYKHCGCRCWPCRRAMLTDHHQAERNRAYGRSRLVPATPARDHLRRLMDAGMGRPRIAQLSGVEESILCRILAGKTRDGRRETTQRITRATEARILAVTYDPADGGPAIDGDTTARRLRALVALGFWPSLLARESGLHVAYIGRLLAGRRVRPGTARRIHDLYRRLADAPPPAGPYADRARRLAKRNGWRPPQRLGGRLITGAALEDPYAA